MSINPIRLKNRTLFSKKEYLFYFNMVKKFQNQNWLIALCILVLFTNSLQADENTDVIIPNKIINLFSSSGLLVGPKPFAYRIPALATTNSGRLLAVCDARFGTPTDLPNNIDLVLRISDDNGDTWSSIKTIVNSGGFGSGDPQILVDQQTSDIFIFYAYKVKWTAKIDEIRYVKSTDNGDTWSAPINIKSSVFNPEDINMWAGPGNGIQLRSGRLIAPFSLNSKGNQDSIQTCFIYSDDHGETWNRSINASGTGLEEPTIVELNNGQLMLNARSRRGFARRGISYTDENGENWSDTYDHPDLLDPIVQGSMIRYTSTLDGYSKNRLLFSNPRHLSKRENLTVHLSYDEGNTWPVKKVLDPNGSAYSSLTILENGDIGILYEQDYRGHTLGIVYPKNITFARLTLQELTNNLDSLMKCEMSESVSVNEKTSNSAKISWSTQLGKYDLQYKENSSDEWLKIINVTSPLILENLFSETLYDVRVIYECSDSTQTTSNTTSFTTDIAISTGISNESIYEISFYPNPVKNVLFLKNSIAKLNNLGLTDVLGKSYPVNKWWNSTNNSIDVNKLSPGIYWLQWIDSNGNKKTEQFIKN